MTILELFKTKSVEEIADRFALEACDVCRTGHGSMDKIQLYSAFDSTMFGPWVDEDLDDIDFTFPDWSKMSESDKALERNAYKQDFMEWLNTELPEIGEEDVRS